MRIRSRTGSPCLSILHQLLAQPRSRNPPLVPPGPFKVDLDLDLDTRPSDTLTVTCPASALFLRRPALDKTRPPPPVVPPLQLDHVSSVCLVVTTNQLPGADGLAPEHRGSVLAPPSVGIHGMPSRSSSFSFSLSSPSAASPPAAAPTSPPFSLVRACRRAHVAISDRCRAAYRYELTCTTQGVAAVLTTLLYFKQKYASRLPLPVFFVCFCLFLFCFFPTPASRLAHPIMVTCRHRAAACLGGHVLVTRPRDPCLKAIREASSSR